MVTKDFLKVLLSSILFFLLFSLDHHNIVFSPLLISSILHLPKKILLRIKLLELFILKTLKI